MSPLGLLLTALLVPAAPPAPDVPAPQLTRGLELVYRGEAVEASDRVDNRFRKRSELEVRVLVLEAGPLSADCAVMTRLRPQDDPTVAGAAAAVTGSDPSRTPAHAAIRIDLVRVDGHGRCRVLHPPPGPPPIPLGPNTPTANPPPIPLDGPPNLEVGMFVPLPARPVAVGGSWDAADPARPPVGWTAGEAVWNGGRCVELRADQHTDGWDRPAVAPTGWRRTEAAIVSPTDGFTARVHRRVERRDGAGVVGWVEVTYELQPPTRLVGARYADARRDAEAAFAFAADLDQLLSRTGPHDPGPFAVKLTKIDRYLADAATPTGFREAVDGARRRCAAAARGDLPQPIIPASASVRLESVAVGNPAPDFVAPVVGRSEPFRLSSAKGKPAVVVFFKPGSRTGRATLLVAQALHDHFAGRAAVVAVAVGAGPDAADALSKDMKLTFPVVDGAGARDRYGIDTHPRFFALDSAGTVTWRFDGFGLETGYLAKQEVERLIGGGSR